MRTGQSRLPHHSKKATEGASMAGQHTDDPFFHMNPSAATRVEETPSSFATFPTTSKTSSKLRIKLRLGRRGSQKSMKSDDTVLLNPSRKTGEAGPSLATHESTSLRSFPPVQHNENDRKNDGYYYTAKFNEDSMSSYYESPTSPSVARNTQDQTTPLTARRVRLGSLTKSASSRLLNKVLGRRRSSLMTADTTVDPSSSSCSMSLSPTKAETSTKSGLASLPNRECCSQEPSANRQTSEDVDIQCTSPKSNASNNHPVPSNEFFLKSALRRHRISSRSLFNRSKSTRTLASSGCKSRDAAASLPQVPPFHVGEDVVFNGDEVDSVFGRNKKLKNPVGSIVVVHHFPPSPLDVTMHVHPNIGVQFEDKWTDQKAEAKLPPTLGRAREHNFKANTNDDTDEDDLLAYLRPSNEPFDCPISPVDKAYSPVPTDHGKYVEDRFTANQHHGASKSTGLGYEADHSNSFNSWANLSFDASFNGACETGVVTSSEEGTADVENCNPSPVMIEVEPGHFLPLRGREETLRYIRQGRGIATQECFSCQGTLHCISDASCVLCPYCRVAQPVQPAAFDTNGIALGFSTEDWIQETTPSHR